MKRLLVPAALIGLFVVNFTTPALSQSSTNDDVYYSPKNDASNNSATTTAPPATQTTPQNNNNDQNYNNNYYNREQSYPDNSTQRYQNSTSSYATDSTTGNTYVTNNYYGNQYGDGGGFNPYMGYSYDPFYSGFGCGLGFNDGFYPGFGLGLGFGYPYYGYGFGYPYCGFGYGFGGYPYYGGFGYYGEGYGYGGGFASYYGPRGSGLGLRTPISSGISRGLYANNMTSTPRNNIGTSTQMAYQRTGTSVPFSRPSSIAASQARMNQAGRATTQSNIARGNYNANRASAASRTNMQRGYSNGYNRGAATAQRGYVSRNFAPRGGFSSYQNNRSMSSYRGGSANRSFGSSRSYSSPSFSRGSSGGGYSGGGARSSGGSFGGGRR